MTTSSDRNPRSREGDEPVPERARRESSASGDPLPIPAEIVGVGDRLDHAPHDVRAGAEHDAPNQHRPTGHGHEQLNQTLLVGRFDETAR